MLLAFFVILIFIVAMDVEPPAPIAAVLAVEVAVPLCGVRFQISIYGRAGSWYFRRLKLGRRCFRICHARRKRLDARRLYFHHAR